MNQQVILDLMRGALWTVIITAAPPLMLGLIVGLVVSIFQTVTSIQEATLAFVPKILAVLLAILLFGPFMISNLSQYMIQLYENLPNYIH